MHTTSTEPVLRRATADDRPFLAAMLAEAAAWRDGVDRPVAEIVAPPEISHYLPTDWPRSNEAGMVAGLDGVDIGAAWWTGFTINDPGYGFVAEDVPELTIGVVPDRRGQGIGRALLAKLCARADRDDLRGLSLSVETDNPAIRLYERAGFTRIDEQAGAATMVRWSTG